MRQSPTITCCARSISTATWTTRSLSVPASQAIYLTVLGRTFFISAMVTLLTLVLAYPVAFMLAHAPERVANLLLIFVLVPFWTSLLVRTTAWFVLLQDQGPINDFLRRSTPPTNRSG